MFDIAMALSLILSYPGHELRITTTTTSWIVSIPTNKKKKHIFLILKKNRLSHQTQWVCVSGLISLTDELCIFLMRVLCPGWPHAYFQFAYFGVTNAIVSSVCKINRFTLALVTTTPKTSWPNVNKSFQMNFNAMGRRTT